MLEATLSRLRRGLRHVIRKQVRPLRYEIVWARLLREAARKSIPAHSLDRVHTYLRSHYKKELFPHDHQFQNPRDSYFPGLRARAIWDPREIEWTILLEQAYPQIKAELLEMIGRVKLSPHPQNLTDKGSWRVKYFWHHGEEQEEAHRLCPNTSAVLKACMPTGSGNQVFCSVLDKQSHIAPHCGPINTRLTCHLGLVIQRGCSLRVGTEVLNWQEGKCLVFDDSFEHEAWNNSDGERIVLLIQFWHPDLTDAEVWAIKAVGASLYRF
jgi:aspartyl/asparaginyl beta-hydroxylase (cupin superfamily)